MSANSPALSPPLEIAMWSRLLALALLLMSAPAVAGVKEKIAALAPSAVVLVVDGKGDELVAQNADQSFVPASVAKIVTAWLAIEVLGADYRFETRFYLDSKRTLYVRGGGDPFLVSEELAPLAKDLVAKIGKAPIAGIVVDGGYYPPNLRIPGIEDDDEAYDALNSALAVNFNTVYAVRSGNRVRSAEEQTPITPIAIARFRAKGPDGEGRISLGEDPALGLRYAGELIGAFIERAGVRVKGAVSTGTVPDDLKPVYVHQQSRTLPQILAEMLLELEQFHRQPGLSGDRRSSPGRAGEPREVASGRKPDARRAGPRGGYPSRGGLRHQPRRPLLSAGPRQGAGAVCAPRRPAPRP